MSLRSEDTEIPSTVFCHLLDQSLIILNKIQMKTLVFEHEEYQWHTCYFSLKILPFEENICNNSMFITL